MAFDNSFTLIPVYNAIKTDKEKVLWVQNMIDNLENVIYYNIRHEGETKRVGKITDIWCQGEALKGRIQFFKNYNSTLSLFLLYTKIGNVEIFEKKEYFLAHPFDPQSGKQKRVFTWNVVYEEIDYYKWIIKKKDVQKSG